MPRTTIPQSKKETKAPFTRGSKTAICWTPDRISNEEKHWTDSVHATVCITISILIYCQENIVGENIEVNTISILYPLFVKARMWTSFLIDAFHSRHEGQ